MMFVRFSCFVGTLDVPLRAGSFLCLVLLGVLSGCNKQATVEVSGTVSFEGTPIEQGNILFVSTTPSQGPSGGPITNGSYKFRAPAGTYIIQITASRVVDGKPSDMGATYVDFIPNEYNTNSILTEEVKAGGANTLHFALPLKGASSKGPPKK